MEKQSLIQNVGFFHPTRRFYRYTVLAVISLICFGSYFAFDEIQPIADDLDTYLGINTEMFTVLYSVYSIPNMILVFFGGILGDKIGLRLAGLIFVSLTLAGVIIVAFAPSFSNAYVIMAIGRTVFGMGAESLNTIQIAMVARWFSGAEMAMAFGIVLSLSRLGDYLAVTQGGNIARLFGTYRATLWTGVALTVLSYISVIVYSIMDKYADKIVKRNAPPPEKLNLLAVFKFDGRFWLVSLLTLVFYSAVTPFVAIADKFIPFKWGYLWPNKKDRDFWSEQISGIPILASMILAPFLGRLVDAVGRRPYFLIFGSLAIIPAHFLLGLTYVFPAIPIVVIGLAYSLVPSCLWPAIPIIIAEENTATAYGLMTAIQNAGLAGVNFIGGKISHNYGYDKFMICLAVVDVIACLLAQILFWVDKIKGSQLCQKTKKTVADEKIESINNQDEAQSLLGTI
jgi:MFS family permease